MIINFVGEEKGIFSWKSAYLFEANYMIYHMLIITLMICILVPNKDLKSLVNVHDPLIDQEDDKNSSPHLTNEPDQENLEEQKEYDYG
jgi:hypothetical protein